MVHEIVQITNVTTIGDPELAEYGKMKDMCNNFTFQFLGGKSYGIICECGAGGWGLSYALSGKGDIIEGQLLINRNQVNKQFLMKYGWYVGDDFVGKGAFGRIKRFSIRQQITNGLKQSKTDLTMEQICSMLELSDSRLDRDILSISNERWNASVAIGLAHNRKLFCFPWLNTGWVNTLFVRLQTIAHVLKEQGAILIIPTAKTDVISKIVDETLFLIDPDEFIEIM